MTYKLTNTDDIDLIIDVGKAPDKIGQDAVYRQNALFAGKDDAGIYHPIGHVVKNGEWYQRYYRDLPWSAFIVPIEGRPYVGKIDPSKINEYKLAFQATPSLIKDGVVFVNHAAEQTAPDIWQTSTQRSGIGVYPDGQIQLITTLESMTLTQFANMGKEMGLIEMLNLDGGGSVYPRTGWVRPTSSAIVVTKGEYAMHHFKDYARMTSPFGWRTSPITGKREFHTGVDLVKEHDSPIYAFVPGTVTHAKEGVPGSGFGGYGNVVAIRDQYGSLHVYAHLNHCLVTVGQQVERGQVIGRQGSTGQSTGSHLHYEIRKHSFPQFGWIADRENNCYDPSEYLDAYFAKESEPKMSERFKDVPANHWAAASIKKAAESGVMAGVSDTEFGLGQPVTREQLAVILDRVGLLNKESE